MAPKSKPANNAPAKDNASAPSPANGSAATASATTKKDAPEATSTTVTRPDKKQYDAEQERIKREIETLQAKLSTVKDKIGSATRSGPGNERRNELRAEQDGLRNQKSSQRQSREAIDEQIKRHRDSLEKKIKDLKAAKAKMPYKTVAELDAHIKALEKQVESGTMKLADEKRALQEISTCKRNRRVVETFQADQEAIDAEQGVIDELRKQKEDPQAKAISDRLDAIRAELDAINKEGEEAYNNRSELFKERDTIQAEINALFNQKRESAQNYRESNDRYWNKVNEDRARRQEKARAQRAAEEAQKKREVAERLREEAEIPAFQAQIEDCQTLIDSLSGKTTGNVTFKTNGVANESQDLAGVPKLDLRTVDAPEGLVARKKKGEDEESYFVGGKTKAKGKKPPKTPTAGEPASAQLNLPFSTLSALSALSIPPPSSGADVPRVIEDLKTKKAWYEANQSRVTAENIAKAESEIQRLAAAEAKKNTEEAASDEPSAVADEATPVQSEA